MVRINRTYSIEQDLVEKLKEEANNSELINNLLETHFNRANSKDLQHLKKELDILDNNIDSQRRERDRKADIIRNIENQTNNTNNLLLEEEHKRENEKLVKKNIFNLIKQEKLIFSDYRIFKESLNFKDLSIKLFNNEITLEEFKIEQNNFIENYKTEEEEERKV